jgi:hypothetical protein
VSWSCGLSGRSTALQAQGPEYTKNIYVCNSVNLTKTKYKKELPFKDMN